jgi:hypothetical protein
VLRIKSLTAPVLAPFLAPIMARLSRRSLRIHLAQQHVMVAACEGAAIAGTLQLAVVNPGGDWHAPLDTLRTWLAAPHGEPAVQAALAARVPLSVSLAGRWCPAAMAPWSDALLAEPAATRFLQLQLSSVYGDSAHGWRLACDEAPYGQPRAVCGIDAGLLQALSALCTEARLPCGAIEPVMGALCRFVPGARAYAIAEQGRLTLMALAHGRIAALQSQPCGPAWPQELLRAWQRWTLRMPELDPADGGVGPVAVIDLTGIDIANGPLALPAPFYPAPSPFGALPAMAEALCA